ncbi:MAG: alpha/beta hydrolase [Candidatus Acetothermia bacterium]|nr:alpha/beta hydrolase [Candidatus Acetothermia bacterium]
MARAQPLLGLQEELRIPPFVITSDNRVVSPEVCRRLWDLLPGAKVALVPSCGHLPHEKRPGEFLTAVGAFLQGHAQGR